MKSHQKGNFSFVLLVKKVFFVQISVSYDKNSLKFRFFKWKKITIFSFSAQKLMTLLINYCWYQIGMRSSSFYHLFHLMQAFPNQPGLLRNMMGLLGNVAEVEELRPQLMTTQFVSVFSELLYSPSDGIEVKSQSNNISNNHQNFSFSFCFSSFFKTKII